MTTIKEIRNLNEFNEFINREGTVNIVKFFGEWCQPCKLLTQNIINLTAEDTEGVLFAEVDVDNDGADEICSLLDIRSIPVLAFYRNGEMIGKNIGLLTMDGLRNKIKEYVAA